MSGFHGHIPENKVKLPYENNPIANLQDIICNISGVIHDSGNSNGFDEVCVRTLIRSIARISLVIDDLEVRSETDASK